MGVIHLGKPYRVEPLPPSRGLLKYEQHAAASDQREPDSSEDEAEPQQGDVERAQRA